MVTVGGVAVRGGRKGGREVKGKIFINNFEGGRGRGRAWGKWKREEGEGREWGGRESGGESGGGWKQREGVGRGGEDWGWIILP